MDIIAEIAYLANLDLSITERLMGAYQLPVSWDASTITCAKCRAAMRDRALDAQQQALRSAAAATKRAARRAREADVWGKIDQPEVPDA